MFHPDTKLSPREWDRIFSSSKDFMKIQEIMEKLEKYKRPNNMVPGEFVETELVWPPDEWPRPIPRPTPPFSDYNDLPETNGMPIGTLMPNKDQGQQFPPISTNLLGALLHYLLLPIGQQLLPILKPDPPTIPPITINNNSYSIEDGHIIINVPIQIPLDMFNESLSGLYDKDIPGQILISQYELIPNVPDTTWMAFMKHPENDNMIMVNIIKSKSMNTIPTIPIPMTTPKYSTGRNLEDLPFDATDDHIYIPSVPYSVLELDTNCTRYVQSFRDFCECLLDYKHRHSIADTSTPPCRDYDVPTNVKPMIGKGEHFVHPDGVGVDYTYNASDMENNKIFFPSFESSMIRFKMTCLKSVTDINDACKCLTEDSKTMCLKETPMIHVSLRNDTSLRFRMQKKSSDAIDYDKLTSPNNYHIDDDPLDINDINTDSQKIGSYVYLHTYSIICSKNCTSHFNKN